MHKTVTYRGFLLVIMMLQGAGWLSAFGVSAPVVDTVDGTSAQTLSDAASTSISSGGAVDAEKAKMDALMKRAQRVFGSDLYDDGARYSILRELAGGKDMDGAASRRQVPALEVMAERVHIIKTDRPRTAKYYAESILFAPAALDGAEYGCDPYLHFRFECFAHIYLPFIQGSPLTHHAVRRYFADLIARGCISREQAHFMKCMDPWKRVCCNFDVTITPQKCVDILHNQSLDVATKTNAFASLCLLSPGEYRNLCRGILNATVNEIELSQDPLLESRFFVYAHYLGSKNTQSREELLAHWRARGILTEAQRDRVLEAWAIEEDPEAGIGMPGVL